MCSDAGRHAETCIVQMSEDHNVLPRRVIRVSKINLYMLSADIVQTALVAVRFRSCRTHSASVIDEAVAEVVAFFRRDDLPESHLDFLRIFLIDQTDTVAQADTVCIRHDRRLAEYIAHDQVGTFTAHARK